MKIRYLELEDCLRDAGKWAARKSMSVGLTSRPGYDYCLREGIYQFHKYNDPERAKAYILQTLINRKLDNGVRTEVITEKFDSYVKWFGQEKVTVAACRVILSHELSKGIAL